MGALRRRPTRAIPAIGGDVGQSYPHSGVRCYSDRATTGCMSPRGVGKDVESARVAPCAALVVVAPVAIWHCYGLGASHAAR